MPYITLNYACLLLEWNNYNKFRLTKHVLCQFVIIFKEARALKQARLYET